MIVQSKKWIINKKNDYLRITQINKSLFYLVTNVIFLLKVCQKKNLHIRIPLERTIRIWNYYY